jgi:2-polyprenyl-3-methyl-5-hydroxy-6-metoxy-1,4-benzoquinol methylase
VSGNVKRPEATEDVPCNLCGAPEYDVVGRIDREGRPLQTVMCRACGLVRTNPRPAVAAMDGYYASTYRTDYTGASAPALRKVLRGMLGARDRRRALQPLLRDGARVLDVGCGAGELVYLLRGDRFDASGLEPGEEYAEFARRVLGVPVQTATVDTADIEPGSRDVVTMFHCLEHVPDPRRVLAAVRGWLREGGVVVVEVPNVESTVQAPSHRFHYAHLFHFSGATLAALGEAAGLRVIRTTYSDDGGNVTCVFRRESDEERSSGIPGDREERRPEGLAGSRARTRSILQAHTALRHYLSPTPYRRAIGRLARRWREDRLLRRLGTLEAVLRWALADVRKSRLH